MRRSTLALAAAILLAPVVAGAQIDGERRTLLEGGGESGLGNPGPVAPYAFMYFNRPDVVGKGSAWRLALAPVYADTELGVPGLLGGHTDMGFGFSGGGYAFGHAEVRRGDEKRGESFIGHGGGPSLSLYPNIGHVGPVPITGVFRFALNYTDYLSTKLTDPAFELPPDVWTGSVRGGLRAGGAEPGMDKGRAVEFSMWAETRVRANPASYGYNKDRDIRRSLGLLWARAFASLPVGGATRLSGGLNLGVGEGLGRLDAYRLGGMSTVTSEFPLVIPGYFAQEISAARYAHAWAQTALPVGDSKRFTAMFTVAGASVDPVFGTDPGGPLHAGAAMGFGFEPPDGALRAELTYGFSPTALRGTRRFAQSVAVVFEVDFLRDLKKVKGRPKVRQQGLRWLLGR